MRFNFKELRHELTHHLPFTALATLIGLAVFVLFEFVFSFEISKEVFEALHPLHVIVSGIATAGIFYKYKKNFMLAFFIGVIGAIAFGTLSDVLMPYLGSKVFSFNPEFHLPLIKNTFTIVSASVVGSIFGIMTATTKTSHSLHVFLSVFASLFYLMTFSSGVISVFLLLSAIIVIISVVIPCCLSDIIFPSLLLGRKIKSCDC